MKDKTIIIFLTLNIRDKIKVKSLQTQTDLKAARAKVVIIKVQLLPSISRSTRDSGDAHAFFPLSFLLLGT